MDNTTIQQKINKQSRQIVKIRSLLFNLRIETQFHIKEVKFARGSDNLLKWFYWSFLLFKAKRNLKRMNHQILELSMINLQYKCKIFHLQYLKRDLRTALKTENYEQAAIIRDLMIKKKPES